MGIAVLYSNQIAFDFCIVRLVPVKCAARPRCIHVDVVILRNLFFHLRQIAQRGALASSTSSRYYAEARVGIIQEMESTKHRHLKKKKKLKAFAKN